MNKTTLGISVALAITAVLWYTGIFSQAPRGIINPGDISDLGGAAGTIPEGSDLGFAMLAPNAIYVAEQWPGVNMIINIVALELPGYVIIHESRDGNPGAIIGKSDIVESGGGENIKVTLSRAAKDGEEFIAMLHSEKGGLGFDPSVDTPVLENGVPIHMVFQISADAPDPSSIEIRF